MENKLGQSYKLEVAKEFCNLKFELEKLRHQVEKLNEEITSLKLKKEINELTNTQVG